MKVFLKMILYISIYMKPRWLLSFSWTISKKWSMENENWKRQESWGTEGNSFFDLFCSYSFPKWSSFYKSYLVCVVDYGPSRLSLAWVCSPKMIWKEYMLAEGGEVEPHVLLRLWLQESAFVHLAPATNLYSKNKKNKPYNIKNFSNMPSILNNGG